MLVSNSGVMIEYFSHQLSARVLQLLGDPEKKVKKTVIYECERLAFAGALRVWGDTIKGCDVFGYVDNNPSCDWIMSGGTSSSHATPVVYDILVLEETLGVRLWVARVPSPSNVSDAPSCLQCQQLDSLEVHSGGRNFGELLLSLLSKQWSG